MDLDSGDLGFGLTVELGSTGGELDYGHLADLEIELELRRP